MAIGFDFGDKFTSPTPASIPDPEPDKDVELADARRTVAVFKTMSTQHKMRLLSEAALTEALPWHLEEGAAYHVLSAGDVDSLTYLRHIAREQRLDYVALATWCMATSDAKEMLEWCKRGDVGRFDFYVGEIFKDGYRGCLEVLDEICRLTGGRVARFRNHSKLMLFFGERYSGAIESSANVDTNPRTEQTCITVDRPLAEFYLDYFDDIKDFDGRYEGWQPWSRAGYAPTLTAE